MPKLYICNTSQQKHEFIYRIPERLQTSAPLMILPGSQIMVLDAPSEVLDAVIEQHRTYNLKHQNEINTNSFNGLVYSIDKPVELDTIFLAEEANTEVLNEMGSKIRQEQAAAFSNTLDENVGSVASLQVEIVEEGKPGAEPSLNETIEIEKPKRTRKK